MKSNTAARIVIEPVFAMVALFVLLSCTQKAEEETASDVIDRIAFGSCAMHWLEQPVWKTIAQSDPDLFLFVGDAIYGDWDGEKVVPATEESLRRDWGILGAIPEFAHFRERVPMMATWDNHDYGSHNGGAEFELKHVSREIFLDFFGDPADSERRGHPGVYDAVILGPERKRVQVVLLDTRSFKGPFMRDERTEDEKQRLNIVGKYAPNTDPAVTLLGEQQWDWLEAQLRKPADVRFIVSSTQVIPDEKGMDEWGNYPHERRRLFDLVAATGAQGVMILSGNVHFAEVSAVDTDAYPLVEFTSSGLTHVNERYAQSVNSYRIAGPSAEINFGLVELDWNARAVTLACIGVDGTVSFTHKVSLDRLRVKGDAR